jgi:hypothetical protein
MRKIALALALTVTGLTSAWADDGVVRLDTAKALANLRASNPAHYAQAVEILASANHLCRPTGGELQQAQSESDASCSASVLQTSNPPKREIRFSLDRIQYAARVTVTDDPPRLLAASGK